ncbi:MAG: 50S ribosomal protein L35 [Candidatus Gracilibacteria bacterium]|nr:50S ribosomal protein L35 [Candidatus Gracilibacteria bacterium]
MKQKSNSSAKKRFKKTGSGKIMHEKSAKNHLLKNKSKRQKKFGADGITLSGTTKHRVSRMVPNL